MTIGLIYWHRFSQATEVRKKSVWDFGKSFSLYYSYCLIHLFLDFSYEMHININISIDFFSLDSNWSSNKWVCEVWENLSHYVIFLMWLIHETYFPYILCLLITTLLSWVLEMWKNIHYSVYTAILYCISYVLYCFAYDVS